MKKLHPRMSQLNAESEAAADCAALLTTQRPAGRRCRQESLIS